MWKRNREKRKNPFELQGWHALLGESSFQGKNARFYISSANLNGGRVGYFQHEPAFGMTALKLDQTHMKMKLKGAGIWHDSSQTMSWSVPYHEAEGSRHLTWQLSNNDTIRPISRREAGCKKGGQMQGNSLSTLMVPVSSWMLLSQEPSR